MSNEVIRVSFSQLIFMSFLLFLLISPTQSEIAIKLTHEIFPHKERLKFFERLEKHKKLANKAHINFLKANEPRFKESSTLTVEEEMEMERRFARALLALHNYKDSQYIATFLIGVPPQPIKIMFDTGSCNFWITSTECKSKGCKVHKGYDPAKSKFFKFTKRPLNIQFGSGKVKGQFVYDTVQFGPLSVVKQEFGLMDVEEGEIFETLHFNGLLGLSYPLKSAKGTIPFFDNIMRNNLLKRNYFSLYLTYHKERADAQIILGQPEQKYYSGKYFN